MPSQSYQSTLITAQADGAAKTASAAASILPVGALLTLPPNYFSWIGQMVKVTAHGRISCAVTTPGTVRLDLRLGGTVVYDTGALNLNIVAKTNVPWWLEVLLCVRTIGTTTTATLFGLGNFQSEAIVGAPLPTVGGNGSLLCPVGAPAVGGGFDSTASKVVDLQHTQTVATGSITLHMFKIESLN